MRNEMMKKMWHSKKWDLRRRELEKKSCLPWFLFFAGMNIKIKIVFLLHFADTARYIIRYCIGPHWLIVIFTNVIFWLSCIGWRWQSLLSHDCIIESVFFDLDTLWCRLYWTKLINWYISVIYYICHISLISILLSEHDTRLTQG